jgi:hypothetical protein
MEARRLNKDETFYARTINRVGHTPVLPAWQGPGLHECNFCAHPSMGVYFPFAAISQEVIHDPAP